MKNVMLFSCFLIGLAMLSCKKEGCLDDKATNYDADAKKDDGSCIYDYSADISFWFNEATSDHLISEGVTILNIKLDNESVGTMDPIKWVTGPECDGEDRFTATVKLGNNNTGSVEYVVTDQMNIGRFAFIATITADECTSVQLF